MDLGIKLVLLVLVLFAPGVQLEQVFLYTL